MQLILIFNEILDNVFAFVYMDIDIIYIDINTYVDT